MIPIDNFLHYPANNPNPRMIMVCSISSERRKELFDILISSEYGVCGPFESYLDIFEILGRTEIAAIVFDTRDNYSNSFKFLNGMSRFPEYPLLMIGPLDHTINSKLSKLTNKVVELNFPIVSSDVIRKIRIILNNGNKLEESKVVLFLNEVFENILKISPREKKAEIRKILVYHVEQLAQGSDYFEINSENAIFVTSTLETNDMEMIKIAQRVLRDLIDSLNYKLNVEEEWGKSIVHDAMYQAYYRFKGTDGPVRELLVTLEINDIDFYNKISGFVKIPKERIDCNIAHLVLEDQGPVVDCILNDKMFLNVFTPMTASQIISLVGQGENYHEGLFGPIPSSADPEAMILIYSRILNDDTMEDHRLHGKTISVLAVAFHKDNMNILPPRTTINKIFSEFVEAQIRQEVTIELMARIREKFLQLFSTEQ